jgi:hypothetical protein
MELPSEGSQLGNGTPERQEFIFGLRTETSQMGSASPLSCYLPRRIAQLTRRRRGGAMSGCLDWSRWPDRSLPLELGCRAQLSFRKHLRSHGHWSVFISSVTCAKHREIGAQLFLSMLPPERAADAIFGRG